MAATVLLLSAALPSVALAAGGNAKATSASSQPSTATPSSPAPAAPSPTGATGNPFGGVTPISPTPTAPSTPTAIAPSSTSTSGGGSLSGSSVLVIVLGALIVLGGISYFIWRDARRRAPVRAGGGRGGDPGLGEGRRAGSKAPPKPRKLSPAERRRRKRGRARR